VTYSATIFTCPGGSPVGYRHECECEAVLADGSLVTIRPIRPDDFDSLAAFHSNLSADTVYRRFLGHHRQLSTTELNHFTVVDYDRRLALIAKRNGEWVAVGRYDAEPGSDRAEVAFVVSDASQHLGIGTLLLEHLAAAGRRRGLAFFTAETLGTNAPMQQVFHDAGFECVQNWGSGVADVVFPIAVTDRYLKAVLTRDRFAIHARIGASFNTRPPSESRLVGVACSSAAGGAAMASACRDGGLEISTVLTAQNVPRSDLSDLLAALSADCSTAVVVAELEDLHHLRRLVARCRTARQHKPIVALLNDNTGGSSDTIRDQRAAWKQAGVELATGIDELVGRAAELVQIVAAGAWVPTQAGRMAALTGYDVTAAWLILQAARASNRDLGGPEGFLLASGFADELLRSYGLDPTEHDSAIRDLTLRVADDPLLGLHARLIAVGAEVAAGPYYLPLTFRDAQELVVTALPSGSRPEFLVDTVLRLARLVDDQADIELVEMSLGYAPQPPVVRVGPTRQTDDDPLLRRLVPGCDKPVAVPAR
jgi:GNAT superfamily N-acetyltransferase